MPDVREKLVEILDESFDHQYDKNLVITARNTANDLIANGVTIQRWIPVTERLPETHKNEAGCVCSDVLVFRERTTVHMGYCVKQIALIDDEPVGMTKWYDQSGYRWEDVTHWMPLPDAPKEE